MKLETAVKYTICQQILDFLMKILLDTSREAPPPLSEVQCKMYFRD